MNKLNMILEILGSFDLRDHRMETGSSLFDYETQQQQIQFFFD